MRLRSLPLALPLPVALLLAGCVLLPTSGDPPGKTLQLAGFSVAGPAYWDVLRTSDNETEIALTLKDLKVGNGVLNGQIGTVIGKWEPSAIPLDAWRSRVESVARALNKNTPIERFELNLDGTKGYQVTYDLALGSNKPERQTHVGARKEDRLYTLVFRRLMDDPAAARFDADVVTIINSWKWTPS